MAFNNILRDTFWNRKKPDDSDSDLSVDIRRGGGSKRPTDYNVSDDRRDTRYSIGQSIPRDYNLGTSFGQSRREPERNDQYNSSPEMSDMRKTYTPNVKGRYAAADNQGFESDGPGNAYRETYRHEAEHESPYTKSIPRPRTENRNSVESNDYLHTSNRGQHTQQHEYEQNWSSFKDPMEPRGEPRNNGWSRDEYLGGTKLSAIQESGIYDGPNGKYRLSQYHQSPNGNDNRNGSVVSEGEESQLTDWRSKVLNLDSNYFSEGLNKVSRCIYFERYLLIYYFLYFLYISIVLFFLSFCCCCAVSMFCG